MLLVAGGLPGMLRPGIPEFAIMQLTLLIGLPVLGILAVCLRAIER